MDTSGDDIIAGEKRAMSQRIAEESRQSMAASEDMLAAVDDVFNVMLSSMFQDGAELEQDKEQVLGGLVGVFHDRVKAVESDIAARGGEQSVPVAVVRQRNSLTALRSRAAERFRRETGKEWLPS